MRDDIQGGVLATLIAAPVVVVCCGGGGVALTAITGAVGGLIGGLAGVAIMAGAAVVALTWRSLRRARAYCTEIDDISHAERVQ